METTKEKINRVCPITGLDFFMSIENESGVLVDTYGGPFDSYTTPTNDGDDWVWERYCHDRGSWMGFESVPDSRIIDYLKEQTTSQKQTIERLRGFLEWVTRIDEERGRAGCTYGDTDFDSPSAAKGWNDCLDYIKSKAEKLLNTTEPTNSEP